MYSKVWTDFVSMLELLKFWNLVHFPAYHIFSVFPAHNLFLSVLVTQQIVLTVLEPMVDIPGNMMVDFIVHKARCYTRITFIPFVVAVFLWRFYSIIYILILWTYKFVIFYAKYWQTILKFQYFYILFLNRHYFMMK